MTFTTPNDQSLSQALAAAVGAHTGDYITIAQLVAGIKTRAMALLLVLFCLPNILPSLPGTSAITGLPLTLLTLQMMLGRGVWLPQVVAARSVPRAGFLALLARGQPYFDRIEKLLRPRYLWASTAPMLQVLGGIMFGLSLIILLPIPFGNALPALAIMIIAFGLAERDGAFILAGIAVGIGAVLMVLFLYGALFLWIWTQIAPWL